MGTSSSNVNNQPAKNIDLKIATAQLTENPFVKQALNGWNASVGKDTATISSKKPSVDAIKSMVEKKQKDFSKMDLSGLDLSGIVFHDESNFTGSNLKGANLSGANLVKSNFSEVNLVEANLSGANLSGASNLNGANLTGANLTDTDFRESSLKKSILVGAILEGTNFDSADLEGAKLIKVNETKPKSNNPVFAWIQNILPDTNSTNDLSNVSEATKSSDFRKAKLQGVSFRNAKLAKADFYEADLRGADFSKARLGDVNFTLANLQNSKFTDAKLMGKVVFVKANLQGSTFRGSDWRPLDTEKTPPEPSSSYTYVNMQQANLRGADLTKVKVPYGLQRDGTIGRDNEKPLKGAIYDEQTKLDRTVTDLPNEAEALGMVKYNPPTEPVNPQE